MKLLNKILFPLSAFLLLTATAAAQEPQPVRPVISAYTFEAGSAHLAETYLSPLRYSGYALAVGYERLQAMKFSPDRWVMQMNARIGFENTENPARNASLWDLDLEFHWGMYRRFRLDKGWEAGVGGSTSLDGGIFYNARNSNNPVSAKGAWTVNLLANAAYHTRLLKKDVTLRYSGEMPLTGIFFSPEYDELYYEIWLGNHKNLVRGAWPGNFFRLDNRLTADIRLGGTIIRAGYGLRIFSSKASHIVTQRITHTFILGVASEWISLGARPLGDLSRARVVSALY